MTNHRALTHYERNVAFVGHAVSLNLAHGDATQVAISRYNIGTRWFSHFMGLLQSVGYSGHIDWTHQWNRTHYCVSLHDVSHVDNAVAVIAAIATDMKLAYSNDDWCYSWRTFRTVSPAHTMLSGVCIEDWHAQFGNDTVLGWRLLMPLLDTTLIALSRHQLPTSVERWAAHGAGVARLQEQVG